MTDRQALLRSLDRLRDTLWRRRLLYWTIRAMWLALLVPTVVMAGYLWLGWHVPWQLWVTIMLLVAFVSAVWSIRPINLSKMTRRLDRVAGLQTQLVTALEVSYAADAPAYAENPVADQLVYDAVDASVDLRRQIKLLGRSFWLEMNMLIGIAALLGALLLLDAFGPNLPSAAPVDLPPPAEEPKAEEIITPDPVLMPPPQEMLQSMSQEQIQEALQELADALRDQGASRAVAEGIDRGDVEGAAEEMRRLADRLGELSEEARGGLGESLQEAADNIGGEAPPFTEPLQRGNSSLQNGDIPGAAQSLEDLAEVLDEIAESQTEPPPSEAEGEAENDSESDSGESQNDEQGGEQSGGGDGEGNEGNEGDQPLGEEEERLPIDGDPLELESEFDLEDRVLQPSELDAQTDGDERTSDSPFARQPLNASGDELGPDPLSYPWDKRDIIRQYFTP